MFVLPNIKKIYLGEYVVRDMGADPQCRPVTIGKTYFNNPINISLVETFEKGERPNSKVPDAGLYTIEFNFSRAGRMWYFRNKEDRDEAFDLLIYENMTNG